MFRIVFDRHVAFRAPKWRLHTNLYKFGEKVFPHILHKKNCCDLNLSEVFAYLPSFLSLILDFISLNGFYFYFDLFWMPWLCKPAIRRHFRTTMSVLGDTVASCLVRSSDRSGFQHWPGTLCCVLGQDTLLSQCLPQPRSQGSSIGTLLQRKIPGNEVVSTQVYKWVTAKLTLRGDPAMGPPLASHSGWRGNTPSRFMLQKLGKAQAWWATWLVQYSQQVLPTDRISIFADVGR